MPAESLPLGIVYLSAVKFTGYTAAGYLLNRICRTTRPHPMLFGGARTALGLAVGIAFISLVLKQGLIEWIFLSIFVPIQLGEWFLVLWWFFLRTGLMSRKQWVGYSTAGCLWTYLLDIPAVFVTSGVWRFGIC